MGRLLLRRQLRRARVVNPATGEIMNLNISARAMFGIELVKAAVRCIPGCDVRFNAPWMQMNMVMTNPGSDTASIDIAFFIEPSLEFSAGGNVDRHNGIWDEGELIITLPEETAWKVHGIRKDGVITIDKVEPA